MTTKPAPKKTVEVFGVSPHILKDSYVDRGELDAKISKILGQTKHLALKGASRCGKSWLRQHAIPDALVIQCRLDKTVGDIYREALGALGIKLEISSSSENSLTGSVEASGEVGINLIAKVASKFGFSATDRHTQTNQSLRQDINNLDFIASIILESGRRLVVEDIHYLNHLERKRLAYDLKTLWDYGTYVVVVGVWSESNLFVRLNRELASRIREVEVSWNVNDLIKVVSKGSKALNIDFSESIREQLAIDSYGNAGILQRLTEGVLDEAGVAIEQKPPLKITNEAFLQDALLIYAEELNALYLDFAERVSSGIRTRQNATGIYAHAMATIMAATDDELIDGVPLDHIYRTSHARQNRIQKANLQSALEKIETLQVDEDGRGLVISYDSHRKLVTVVDRQLLLYRKYATVPWPWEELIATADTQPSSFKGDS